jgi:broad specificity phosphatase PhoE
MSTTLPQVYIVRHGETGWSASGRHTGRTDLPLTERGEQAARLVGERLHGLSFDHVLTSPSMRARRSCELAGFNLTAKVDEDLAEWDYGDYEGLRTPEILQQRPNWSLFRDGCPNGESVPQIAARADRVIERLRQTSGNTIIFSSGHISRVIAARWLGADASVGRLLVLDTGSLSILGYEHNLTEPVIRLWNS